MTSWLRIVGVIELFVTSAVYGLLIYVASKRRKRHDDEHEVHPKKQTEADQQRDLEDVLLQSEDDLDRNSDGDSFKESDIMIDNLEFLRSAFSPPAALLDENLGSVELSADTDNVEIFKLGESTKDSATMKEGNAGIENDQNECIFGSAEADSGDVILMRSNRVEFPKERMWV